MDGAFLFLSLFVAGGAGRFLPSRTTATRWTGDIVLCYMDARSTGAYGPEMEELFGWNSAKFGRLLAYHNDSADRGGGIPQDTFFDSFLFTGNTWYNGKHFWPGIGPPMNKTDWEDFLMMELTIGAQNLETAAANISSLLPFQVNSDSCAGGIRPAVILSIPYPDPRQQNFGHIDGYKSGRSLNFSLSEDRLLAVRWWVAKAYAAFQEQKFRHVRLQGFYWFYEEVPAFDEDLLPAVSGCIHNLTRSLMFGWIPYYRPGDPHTGRWRELGFDWVTLQPNYAFNNISASERFPVIKALADNFTLGVEMELPFNVRNPQANGWEGNFDTYLERVRNWEKESGTHVMKSYYYGNVYVHYYAHNASFFRYYTTLFNYVKNL